MKKAPWKTAPISCTCEVLYRYKKLCGKATHAAYPTAGGGWMALCLLHAQRHLKYGGAVPTDELIAKGETWK